MARKTILRSFVLAAVLLACFVPSMSAYAGGVCGGLYTIQWGDTLWGIANMCGTTVDAIYAVNPGLG